MKTVELKIYNQTLKINITDENMGFYELIASDLDDMMFQEEKKLDFLSDVRVAVRVAFMLAVENVTLKKSLEKSDEVIDRIAYNLKSLDI